jgi:hypothetical protein
MGGPDKSGPPISEPEDQMLENPVLRGFNADPSFCRSTIPATS